MRLAPPADLARKAQKGRTIRHERVVTFPGPIPFEHREFRRVKSGCLPRAEHWRELEDALLASREQLLHREFRRGVEIAAAALAGHIHPMRLEGVEMRFVAGRDLHEPGLHFPEPLASKCARIAALRRARTCNAGRRRWWISRCQKGVPGMEAEDSSSERVGVFQGSGYGAATSEKQSRFHQTGISVVKVIASSIRKGNVIEVDDRLYSVISAESFFPARARRPPRSTAAASRMA